ncbi:hypothetical protein [Actinokineospora enzanensis]|uniref:hypothetical protein n=1 Tax=Actinokineospora enzanensis TaxID=155975 RepID=UPI0012ECAA83|nr:hypothetical protein [Actinokineospora enzanensis]
MQVVLVLLVMAAALVLMYVWRVLAVGAVIAGVQWLFLAAGPDPSVQVAVLALPALITAYALSRSDLVRRVSPVVVAGRAREVRR